LLPPYESHGRGDYALFAVDDRPIDRPASEVTRHAGEEQDLPEEIATAFGSSYYYILCEYEHSYLKSVQIFLKPLLCGEVEGRERRAE
jgi:hypothetical protein